MKFAVALLLIVAARTGSAQTTLTHTEAISAIYGDYDPATETSPWSCPADFETKRHEKCTWIGEGLKRVSVEIVTSVQIEEEGIQRDYVVTSVVPFHGPMENINVMRAHQRSAWASLLTRMGRGWRKA
jgi:hypothetical protein